MFMQWRFKHPMSCSASKWVWSPPPWWSDQETQENNDGPAFAFQRISWDAVKACACRTSCQSTAQLFQHELSHTCTHTRTYTHTRARNISSVFPTLNIALHTQHFHTQPFHIQVFRTSFFQRQLFHTHHSFTDNSFTHSFAYNFDTLNSFHTPRFHTNLSNTSLPHTTFLTYRSSTTSFFFPPCPVRFNWFWLLEEVHLWGYPVLYLFEIMKSR
jgi:hypothetical protein